MVCRASQVNATTVDEAEIDRKRKQYNIDVILNNNLEALEKMAPDIILFAPPPTVAPVLIGSVLYLSGGFGLGIEPGTSEWWMTRPVWVGVLIVFLVPTAMASDGHHSAQVPQALHASISMRVCWPWC